MPGSVALDTAIELMFVFLTASLICSATIGWLSNRLNKRGEYLLRGLREMLDIPPATPDAPAATGTVEPTGKRGLLERAGRQTRLQKLAVKGVELRDQMIGPQQGVTMPAPLADLVLAHPIIAAPWRLVRRYAARGLPRTAMPNQLTRGRSR